MTDTPSSESHHPGRQAAIWILKIGVSAGLLYLVLRRNLGPTAMAARHASIPWLAAALGLFLVQIFVSAWRWGLLVRAQGIAMPFGALLNSYLVATFFNNFLPSNIGGDVIRIGDSARRAGSTTLAAIVVLFDRGIGLLGLGFVAAIGASVTAWISPTMGPIGPGLLWAGLAVVVAIAAWAILVPQSVGRLLSPARRLHPEWFDERLERLHAALDRFRRTPAALGGGFCGSICVQALLVLFYAAIARGLHVDVPLWHLAIVVPLSFIVLMLPISVNGLGVREATFVLYLSRLGVPAASATALSLTSYGLIALFSTSGAIAYLIRPAGARRQRTRVG
jgi:glycosyltransferase 2 family protein